MVALFGYCAGCMHNLHTRELEGVGAGLDQAPGLGGSVIGNLSVRIRSRPISIPWGHPILVTSETAP